MVAKTWKSAAIAFSAALLFALLAFLYVTQHRTRPTDSAQPGFLSEESDYYVADELAGHVHRSYARRVYPWPEHPAGEITLQTNNLGFRNDQGTLVEKAEGVRRVFILGDSHIDGVLPNAENAAAQLQTLLNAGKGQASFEVLNLGAGYYTFANYAGAVEKFAYLQPDAIIVVVYTGNDFLEAIKLAAQHGQVSVPKRDEAYYAPLKALLRIERASAMIAQSFNQIYFFKHFPQLQQPALQLAEHHLSAIKAYADERQLPLLVVLLPTKPDTEWRTDADALQRFAARAGLSREDLGINRRLSRSLRNRLLAKGITTLDLFERLQNSADEYFWRQDYHINHLGHALLAKTIAERYASLFERQPP